MNAACKQRYVAKENGCECMFSVYFRSDPLKQEWAF